MVRLDAKVVVPASVCDAAPTDPYRTDPHKTVDPNDLPSEAVAVGRRVGDFEILSEVGEAGGMGVVYRARDTRLDRTVAIKMPLRLQAEDAGRFRAEVEAAAQLDHPGIVPIYHVGDDGGRPYFAMAFMEGGSLARRVSKEGALSGRTAATLVRAVAEAVDYAHGRGVIHRDLKPANILLSSTGSPRVTDFGLAKRIETASDLTHTGQVLGTPSYMPPEQARGDVHAVGPLADVYALGGVLYHTITGRPPFLAATVEATLQQVFDADPASPRSLNPGIDRDLETIVLRCLEKEPRQRYTSAGELASDLGRFLAGEPIRARPATLAERAWKWARRRPAVAALVAVSVLTLASLAAGGVFYAQAADRQARLARAEANARAQELSDRDALDAARRRTQESLRHAAAAIDSGDLQEAEKELAAARATAGTQTLLAGERQDVESLTGRLVERQAAEQAKADARQRLAAFDAHRDDAVFFGTHRFGVDEADHLRRTLAETRAGLGLFGIEPGKGAREADALSRYCAGYSGDEQRQILERLYELLLVFAAASARAGTASEFDAPPSAGLAAIDMAVVLAGRETRASRLHRAECLAAAGDAARSETERRRAEAEKPGESAADQFLLGTILTKPDIAPTTADFNQAKTAFEHAIRLDPEHFWAQYALGMLGLRMGRSDMADVHLTACLAKRPDFAWAWILRGSARAKLGEPNRAAEDFDHSLSLRVEPEARYVSLVNRAVLVDYPQGRIDAARSLLREAVAIMPSDSQALAALATLEAEQGRPEEALPMLDQAARVTPDEPRVYRLRGEVQATLHNFEAAERDLRAAAALSQPSLESRADHLTQLGQVFVQQGRLEEAARVLEESRRLSPDVPKTHLWRGAVLANLGRHEEAIEAFTEFEKAGGQPNAVFHHHRALCRQQTGDFAGAIDDWSRAGSLDPAAKHLHARGAVYLAAGSPAIALKDFERAIAMDPGHADAHFGRALALALGSRHADAVAAADQALELSGRSFQSAFRAATVMAVAAQRVVLTDEELKRPGPTAGQLSIRYLAKSAELLHIAMSCEPASRHSELWTTFVAEDPHFKPLLKEPEFKKLERTLFAQPHVQTANTAQKGAP